MNITCYCEEIIEVPDSEIIDLNTRTSTVEDIFSGKFQNITCPKCGTLLKPEIQAELVDTTNDVDLLFLPEKKRVSFLLGEMKSNRDRVVIGYPELVEFFKLKNSNLDVRAIETIKLFLMEKAGSDEVKILFDNQEDEEMIFHLHGLREDEVAVARIPMKLYLEAFESIKERNDHEDYAILYENPYISINKISITKD